MTTNRIIAVLVSLSTMIGSFACECPEYDLEELDNESYKRSDVVVIADVIGTGPNYKIKTVEILKGHVEGDVLYGTTVGENNEFNSCVYFPKTKGRYLMYLNKVIKNGQSFYQYSQCSGTRLLNMKTRPIALHSDKSNEELSDDTVRWIEYLRTRE